MSNLQMKILNKIGIDRVLHFAFGGWIACLATTWYWAILIALGIGLIKELFYDKWYKKSRFDWIDVLYTVLGGGVTALANYLNLS